MDLYLSFGPEDLPELGAASKAPAPVERQYTKVASGLCIHSSVTVCPNIQLNLDFSCCSSIYRMQDPR